MTVKYRACHCPPTMNPGPSCVFCGDENLPGYFPYTAGVFPLKRTGESPARMFAGEGDPAHTNARFHLLSAGQPAVRLSTAFDSVTLYGRDPARQPDIYGKVGTSGVSVATLVDMKQVYAGFDLCAPNTSVSMTIHGPAPAILAMYFNNSNRRQLDSFATQHGRSPDAVEAAEISRHTLSVLRGTVQADILKEDQGQNTCLFSTEFSLRCMADIQQWFIDHEVRATSIRCRSAATILPRQARTRLASLLSPCQWLHVCGGLSCSWHAGG